MNVIVRLYWQHDLDLVALTLHPMFEMGKWMKKAMPMFVTVAVKNDKAGTEYASDMVLAGSGTELENNRISKLLLELNNIHQKYPDYIEKDIREISQYLERLNTNIYPNSGIELADNKINTFHKITDPYRPSSCEPDGYSDLMDV